jgi:hypothetical protein
MWVLHLRLIFHLNLQYSHLYLLLPIGILGLRYNTCTHIYLYRLEFWGFVAIFAPVLTFYQLEFWGFVAILALVLTSTN